jgi:2-amino-4-hydroxy-6-hydroxymethyldihydropteridine diphosphokinase
MVQTDLLDAVIGLGANLGDPIAAFDEAIGRLRQRSNVVGLSPLYRSRPVGPERVMAQPDFLNAAVRVQLQAAPLELLDFLMEIERERGRERIEHWGPRTLDLDLLWLGDRVVELERLRVPHPRLGERAFALLPLLSLVPTARDPRTGQAYLTTLLSLGTAGLEAVSDARWDALRAALTEHPVAI